MPQTESIVKGRRCEVVVTFWCLGERERDRESRPEEERDEELMTVGQRWEGENRGKLSGAPKRGLRGH